MSFVFVFFGFFFRSPNIAQSNLDDKESEPADIVQALHVCFGYPEGFSGWGCFSLGVIFWTWLPVSGLISFIRAELPQRRRSGTR